MIEYNSLYSLSDPLGNRVFRGTFDTDEDALSLVRGETTPSKKVIIHHSMGGSEPSSVIWTGLAIPIIIEENIVNLLKLNNITGWSVYKVDVFGKHNEKYENYYGLAFKGRCSTIDYNRSETVYREFPGGRYPYLKGKYFTDDIWDGSDFFMEETDEKGHKTGFKYVTEKVVRLFKRHKIKNINFTKLTEEETNVLILEPYKLPKKLK